MKRMTVILALLMMPTSYALNLEGINGVYILAIDGKEVKNSFFSQQENDLNKGEHQIVVRYSNQFNNDQIVESRPAIFTIDLQQDTQISVKNINTQRQAEKRIKTGFAWQIISSNKQYQIKNSAFLKGEGFMPYNDIEKLIVTYNQKNGIVLADAGSKQAVVAKRSNATVKSNVATKSTLISLYQNASKDEKRTFRLWLLEQDMK
ncbi:YccT family protein [Psychromonas hadalis]|uniref:YccT family protein n=1 Tax=Psychromonas hadalis TaxID=211669 RepID=UPI0003B6CBBE|nr:DUF2057 domain-containing protein [Psychromonas hadalis]